jgi:hypothetical protein
VTEEERYLFDLQGYLVIENALTEGEVAQLNDAIDRRSMWEERKQRPEGSHMNERKMHIGPLLEWGEPFRRLMAHPVILPYLKDLIGDKITS